MHDVNHAMLKAASDGDFATVESLVKDGADINYKNQWGTFAIFSAAWEGNIDGLERCHALGADLFHEDANLLCNAAYNGKLSSVQWLLRKGADVNFAFQNTGENALHYTICKFSEPEERTEIVKLLIEAGIDVNQKTIPGASTLCFMRDAFVKGETPLHRAAAYGTIEIIRMLLNAGANTQTKDANGDTPLSWASWYLRDNEVLRLLMYDGVAGIRP